VIPQKGMVMYVLNDMCWASEDERLCPFTYYFENASVNHSVLIECEGPSEVVFCDLLLGRLNFELYRANVPCKKFRV
jgi:hypothetical protein